MVIATLIVNLLLCLFCFWGFTQMDDKYGKGVFMLIICAIAWDAFMIANLYWR